MELYLAIALTLAFTFLTLWLLQLKSKSAETNELENRRLDIERLNAEKAEALMRWESEVKAHQLAKEALIKGEAQTDFLLKSLDRERQIFEESKKSLQVSFQGLAQQALEGNNKQFLELAKSVLSTESEVMKGDLGKKQVAIEEMLKPFSEVLDRYQKHASDLERERVKSYVSVESELRKMAEISSTLTRETTALKDALKKPHIRGRWGEVQLKNCIELAGMSEYADVNFQDSSKVDEKVLRPDMTVKMPGGRTVIVDAKTPIDAFMASLEAMSDEARGQEMLRHGLQVKEHVKKLSSKAYHDHVTHTADFTVMFLPNESFLYAALETQPDLVEFALEKKILIATPPTLVGLLKVIRFGWNEEKLTVNAQKISEASQELHKRLVEFVDAYMSIGKALDKAKAEYDTGLKRMDSRVLVQARRLESLGAKSHKELPEDLGHTPEL